VSATSAISRRRRGPNLSLSCRAFRTRRTPRPLTARSREFLDRGESLYSVYLAALGAIEPDLIITQDLCHVCAATPDDLGAAARASAPPATGRHAQSAFACGCLRGLSAPWPERRDALSEQTTIIAEFERDVAQVERAVASLPRPRVVCLEWLDPPYVAGHWVPEMVARAGGIDALGTRASRRSALNGRRFSRRSRK